MPKAVKPKTPTKTASKAAAPAAPVTKTAPAAKSAPPPKRAAGSGDPALDALTRGLAALQAKNFAQAVELFEGAVEVSDVPEVRDRARQFLVASRQKAQSQAKPAKGAAAAEEADPYLQAVYEKNRGNLAEALEMSRKGGRDQKDERFAYLAASIHAIENRWDEAAQTLARAVEINPKNRIHAFHDPDFAELRKNRDHRALFGLS
jgi:tetratricopeptide (TPR) repeat protein